ncbi:conserved hypothetical protein [Rubrivivax sp. A210]|uniref:methyl-accepting chemotaxis protein n=1 Tax=Rubrivivax sp. A210 TaxID=2772301 RepID=UPI00191AC6B1|nr:methyl-accepting chemotaxis protein [Rubrivivax sp. A210]CAD5372117.1 conserved hypothetical protein [Rubrivivax sp. A210]
MSAFGNWKIGSRLTLGFGLMIIIAIGMAVAAYFKLSHIEAAVARLSGDQLLKVEQLSEIKDNLNVVARGVRNILLLTDASGRKSELERIEKMRARNTELLDALARGDLDDEGHKLLGAVKSTLSPYDAAMNKAIALAQGDEAAKATRTLIDEVRPLQAAYFKAVDQLVTTQGRKMRDAVASVRGAADSGRLTMAVLAALAAMFGVVLALGIERSVIEPIKRAVAVAHTVAAGDLSVSIEVNSRDEAGELLQSLKDMVGALSRLVAQVRQSSDGIATGSSEIATGSADLSQRTEEQAANLEQTAASMDELTAGLRASSETAQQADALAERGVAAARRGGEAVAELVATMGQISESSRKVADIIGVIDGIAFQTNILALNAAVEAARAGEQGRGFAVVATEVRNLAQRSAAAAREIKSLIQGSLERVDAGAKQTDAARHEVTATVEEVQAIGQLVRQITGAITEQSQGVGQVDAAIGQLDEVTQQNAALVEQSSAAAASLSEHAAQLARLVQTFRLAEGARA